MRSSLQEMAEAIRGEYPDGAVLSHHPLVDASEVAELLERLAALAPSIRSVCDDAGDFAFMYTDAPDRDSIAVLEFLAFIGMEGG